MQRSILICLVHETHKHFANVQRNNKAAEMRNEQVGICCCRHRRRRQRYLFLTASALRMESTKQKLQ